MLSNEEHKKLICNFDKLLNESNITTEDFFYELSYCWDETAKKQTNPAVRACLESASDLISRAAFDWYCSTK